MGNTTFEDYLKSVLKETQEAKERLNNLENSIVRLLSMSDKQTMIEYLRSKGLSYSRIAQEVGLSKSAVITRMNKQDKV